MAKTNVLPIENGVRFRNIF